MSCVNKLLFITLSNIGDVILTLPVLDALKAEFPKTKITVMLGPRPNEIFQGNPDIDKLIIYDKHSPLKEKIKLFCELKKEKFDLVVDLRNSLFGALLPAKYKTSPFLFIPKNIRHMKDRHLYKIKNPCLSGRQEKFNPSTSLRIDGERPSTPLRTSPELIEGRSRTIKIQNPEIKNIKEKSLYIKPQDEAYIQNILKENNISERDKIVVISPGARSQIKRWSQDKFVRLIVSLLNDLKVKIILVGDRDDLPLTKYITEHAQYPILDLSARTSISQLAYLLQKSCLLVTNDSAVLHLGSYLDVPTVAIFGPTNELKYGPWSDQSGVVKKDIFCRPCEKAQCRFQSLDCLKIIKVEDVFRQVKNIFIMPHASRLRPQADNFKRILIVRTDKIGDVLLSTPVIKALRDRYPCAYLAMMVSPYAQDIVKGNPYLDEVLIYDKDARHKNWLNSIKFSCGLKKKRFDLAIILHPTNRVHLATFFAGIRRRVGYDRKMGFLLTDRIKHIKHLGEKHELEYNLDLIEYLGISAADEILFMPIRPESENWVKDLFRQRGITESDRLLAVHPGASCISKIWPAERFSCVLDKLIEKYGLKVLLLAGPKDIKVAENVIKYAHHPLINLAGETSVSQLASLLAKCQLFISNDSGPVHIASAVGTPVISIFGRNQKGLSPLRWGPRGKKDRVLHKEVGCVECLAHHCVKDFACLKAITVDDVLSAAHSIIRDRSIGTGPEGTCP